MEQAFSTQYILNSTRDKFSKAIRTCKPLFAFFEITSACGMPCRYPMLDCKYCGMDSTPREDELSTEQVYTMTRNIARAGTVSLYLTGGEPTLRDDIPQIASFAARSMRVFLITNGAAVTADYAQKLKNVNVSGVKVYLNSAQAELHDRLRGPGSYARACDALRACRQAGLKTSIVTAVTSENHKNLQELIRLALEYRATFEATEFLPSPSTNHLVLDPQQRQEMQRYLFEGQKLLGMNTVRFGTYYIVGQDEAGMKIWTDPAKKGSNVGYAFGIYGYGITPNGLVVPDPLIRIGVGDLKTQRLSDIWNTSVVIKNLRHRGRLKGKCARCEYKFVCGGHRGRAYALTGDFMEEDQACWYEPSLS